jgi:glycerol-3-phosphate dehydrogenase (NAD(P)+)
MALAWLLNQGGNSVRLWEYDPEDYGRLVSERANPSRLRSFRLPDEIELYDDADAAIANTDLVVLATPAQHLRSVLNSLKTELHPTGGVINVAKGIEINSLQGMSEVICRTTGISPERVATLSGPSHAEEVVEGMPTAVVAASVSAAFASEVQRTFSIGKFRVYASTDITGVEIGGSLKNIIAIAAGIADGLGLGDNTKGAIMTRGLAEMTRLGVALGAEPETFAGLSGVGDLITTCISQHSRNRHVGERIGQGESLDDILSEMAMVAEGVETTRSGRELARKHDVEMPITVEVHHVLFEGKLPSEAVTELLGRELKAEIWR